MKEGLHLPPKSVDLISMAPYAWLGLLSAALAQAPPLTTARVELYTIGPGDDLFSKFGHAALCVFDEGRTGGRCFNYGTADFSTPGPLTWEVARGRAEFWVSVTPYGEMLRLYLAEDRTIYRQVLPLTATELDEMRRALTTAALPENRYYRYNHFFDNCSTRPRDHIDVATRRALSREAGSHHATFRELIRKSLEDDAGTFLLSELFLGRLLDRPRSEFENMFLPRVLREAGDRHLGITPQVVYRRRAPLGVSPIVPHGLALALGIGVASAFGILAGPLWLPRLLRGAYGSIFGLFASLLVILAFISPLPELRANELLLVFWPSDVFLLAGWSRALSLYTSLRLAGLLLVMILMMSKVLLQPLWPFWWLGALVLGAIQARVLVRSGPVR